MYVYTLELTQDTEDRLIQVNTPFGRQSIGVLFPTDNRTKDEERIQRIKDFITSANLQDEVKELRTLPSLGYAIVTCTGRALELISKLPEVARVLPKKLHFIPESTNGEESKKKTSYSFIITRPENSAKPSVDNANEKAEILKRKIAEAGLENDVTRITVLRHTGMFVAFCTKRGYNFMVAQEEVENVIENSCFRSKSRNLKLDPK